jgi:hypothetical protein
VPLRQGLVDLFCFHFVFRIMARSARANLGALSFNSW